MQHPKFIIVKDASGAISWRAEAANAEITGTSGEETFQDKGWAEQSIRDHIQTVIGASGVSISIDTEFNPVIDYEGFEVEVPEPGPEDITDEEVVETEEPAEESPEEEPEG